jgi:hypothetical protein
VWFNDRGGDGSPREGDSRPHDDLTTHLSGSRMRSGPTPRGWLDHMIPKIDDIIHRIMSSKQKAGAHTKTIRGMRTSGMATRARITEKGSTGNTAEPVPISEINKSRFYGKQRNLMNSA